MELEYIVFGTTYGFSSVSVTDEERRFIEQFYCDQHGTKTFVHKRYNNKVYYTHAIYPDKQTSFCDSKGRGGAFLGITIGFNNSYCQNFEKMDQIFNNIYKSFVDKGFIEETNGKRQFMISDFASHEAEIDNIVINAIKSQNLTNADLVPFQIKNIGEIKGSLPCHPSDMPTFGKAFMNMPYNLVVSEQNLTQQQLRNQRANVK